MGIEGILASLTSRLGGRRVVPPMPAGRVAQVPEEDDAIEGVDAAGEGIPLALFVEYRDAQGQTSHRRIACKAYEPDKGAIRAFCFERRAVRRFRVDRIITCACPATGEVFALQDIVRDLRAGGLPVRDERLARVLTILVFLMQCDREEHPLEREVIEAAAETFALRFDGDEAMVLEGVKMARRLAPDADDFVASLRWIAGREDRARLARLIDQFAERVIVADGVIASEEAYFGGLTRDALRQMMG